ncbi:cytochrome c biogenesis CcdA family protein [Microaceticoccus formicicus]|uniref:cytochrome c biogenesis CcdA family protein n=1 Tax=Microaceticoccus formicicus TaxID=3118105 RepID=UPI003CD0255E|nr:cytochrome c biogenesis protein CcdA [Peptoniphilaceae bacterium AMB_02]
MLDKILLDLSAAIRGGGVMLPLIALLGGFLTSLTPCSLSSLPIIIAYLGAGKKLDASGAFKISLTYALGNGVTLVALGVIAALLGRLVNFAGRWWYLFLGFLMIIMALQLFGVIDIFGKLQQSGRRFEQKKGGAFVLGLLSGFFASTMCNTGYDCTYGNDWRDRFRYHDRNTAVFTLCDWTWDNGCNSWYLAW